MKFLSVAIRMKVTEHYFSVMLFIIVIIRYNLRLWTKSASVVVEIKATVVVYYATEGVSFYSVEDITKGDNSSAN